MTTLILSQKREALKLAEIKASAIAAKDPVAFARLYLGYTPDPWQEKFLRSHAPRICLNCSRQSGKSTSVAVLALWEAIHRPKSTIVLDSPSLRQSQELMMKFSEFLSLVDQSVKLDSDTKLSVRFANGSRVIALPGSEKTIRGISAVTLLVLDEAARIPDELYKSVRPMLAVSGGRLVLLSTPFGPTGFFYEIWEQGGSEWEKFKITANDCPRISKEFLEEEKRSLGSIYFQQEYMCSFIASSATRVKREWLRYEDRAPQNLNVSMGVDLAISERSTSDYTAAAVLGRDHEGNLHVLDVQRMRGSFNEQITFIKQLAAKWNPFVVAIEEVNYQKALIQQLSADSSLNVRGIKPISDKVSRFAPLEARYELGQVYHSRGLPPEFESELLSFPMGAHDDMCDALAYSWHALGFTSCTEWAPPLDEPGIEDEGVYSGPY